MGKTNYYYNPKTCQYEPVRMKWSVVLGYCITLLFTVTLFSVGILIVHSRLFTTAKSKALRLENMALSKNEATMKAELVSVNSLLDNLRFQDLTLHQKLFDETKTEEQNSNAIDRDDVLLASPREFKKILNKLKDRSQELKLKATISSSYYGSFMGINESDVKELLAVPAILPVNMNDVVSLYSGYGNRINPFHKGVYFHPGVDFTAPRNSDVFVTGDGTVTHISTSNIEAGYGNYVEVNHGFGIVTRYAHLETIAVKRGQKITKGSVIGTVGSSGGSIAPHLHYEVVRDDQPVNPMDYFIQGITTSEHARLRSIGEQKNQSLD